MLGQPWFLGTFIRAISHFSNPMSPYLLLCLAKINKNTLVNTKSPLPPLGSSFRSKPALFSNFTSSLAYQNNFPYQ